MRTLGQMRVKNCSQNFYYYNAMDVFVFKFTDKLCTVRNKIETKSVK